MSRIAASLAAVIASLALAACGDDGAEPDASPGGAPASASLDLVLDFQPNAVHTGIYVAERRGLFADRSLEITIREPGASTDAPRLLRSGRAELAIMDIHDLAIARERGADLVGIAAIVQRPLAAVIVTDPSRSAGPADLAGARIGITGLPSDDAVLESVLESGGLSVADVETVTIGFDAVPALLAGRIDAATAFWNAEGVTLAERIPTTELRVDQFGAPSYPELVLVTTPERLTAGRRRIEAAVAAIADGYRLTAADPDSALADLIAAVPELIESEQAAQLEAVLPALGSSRALDLEALTQWAQWDLERGIVDSLPNVARAFDLGLADD
jgi:putative hydroxymethylpyrimidine transport system substrate-binding protein